MSGSKLLDPFKLCESSLPAHFCDFLSNIGVSVRIVKPAAERIAMIFLEDCPKLDKADNGSREKLNT